MCQVHEGSCGEVLQLLFQAIDGVLGALLQQVFDAWKEYERSPVRGAEVKHVELGKRSSRWIRASDFNPSISNSSLFISFLFNILFLIPFQKP